MPYSVTLHGICFYFLLKIFQKKPLRCHHPIRFGFSSSTGSGDVSDEGVSSGSDFFLVDLRFVLVTGSTTVSSGVTSTVVFSSLAVGSASALASASFLVLLRPRRVVFFAGFSSACSASTV